jgi:predicted CXXCH cytochrome family protein
MARKTRFWVISATVLLAACQGENGDTGPAGPTGPAAPGYIALEPAGVVGAVSDPGGDAVPGGTVYFVPASAVAAMGATTTAIDSDTDEPLEDLIRLNGSGYTKATVDTDGVYRLTTLPAGSYFVTFVPASGAAYLPGGSLCRTARPSDALVGTRLDVEVSASIPSDALFVGSSRCISCHGRAHISGTMHRLGIWSPYGAGPLQDVSARRDDLYQALDGKFTAAGTTVYFYGYDSSRGFDKYKTSESAPAAVTPPGAWVASTAYVVGDKVLNGERTYECITAGTSAASGGPTGTGKDITDGTAHWKFYNAGLSFTVRVYDAGTATAPDYRMEITNVAGTGTDDRRVDAIYGGGVNKQRYLAKFEDAGGNLLHYSTLPLQFNSAGQEGYSDRTSKVWRDYHGDWWFDESTKTLKTPASGSSFEKNCVSCHAVGVRIDPTTFRAQTVADPLYGDFDFDGDGVKEEMNIGCETCHGPGSRHWEATGQGKHIVSPKLLTPEREAMLCGQCHSRPTGKFNTDSPVDTAGRMMIAGTSRNDYLMNNAGGGTPAKLDAAAADLWGDASDTHSKGNHSKAHHQQYTDFIRSGLYKNATDLMTCSRCHDPHRKTENPRQLRASPSDNAALCGSCHTTEAGDLEAHLTAESIPSASTKASFAKCTDCHMPKTARTGSGEPGALGTSGTQYWQNDISSHVFDVPAKAASLATKMPTAFTNLCGTCHVSSL